MLGKPHRPVGRDPAEELGIEEVARAAPDFPDPLIRRAPAGGGLVREGPEHGPELGAERPWHQRIAEVCGIQHLAIDIELRLVSGRVADAHRAGVAVPAEVVEYLFRKMRIAVNRLHAPEVATTPDTERFQPVEEIGRLLVIADRLRGVEDQCRITSHVYR